MAITTKQNTDFYSYDLAEKVISKGELYDDDSINQQITNILGTSRGERVFNLTFGSSLNAKLFEIFDQRSGEECLNSIVKELYTYLGNQIVIEESSMRMSIDRDNNSISISIPYSIKNSAKKSVYKKKFII